MRSRLVRAAFAVLAGGVLLTGCDSVAPAATCRVDVGTDDLVADREAAGIADCDAEEWAAREGEPADLPDVELDCLGSTATASLADIRGPAVINVWASTCAPCREEMPVLAEFSDRYGDQVPVIGLDFLESHPAAAIDLARRSSATYPSLADGCGDLQQTDLVLTALPQFLFVSADGSVAQQVGGIDSLDEIVELVETHTGVAVEPGSQSERGER